MALVVNFKNYDGTVLQTLEVESGETPVYTGDTPEKPAGDHVRYEFSAWSPTPAAITEDTDYTAQFTDIPTAEVTFVDYDDSVISGPTTYDVGTSASDITVPDDPTREATQQYTYAFAGWDPAVADVSADVTYKATYDATVNQYSVTFIDDDGTEMLAAADYDYGTPFSSVVKPDTPDKQVEGMDDCMARFDHWTPDPVTVTDDITYQAVYVLIPIAGYKVTFVDDNGYVLEQKEYNYGDTPAYDAPDGFDITYDPTIETVSDDATYEVSLTKVYEIVKQDDSMGKGCRRAAFLLDAGSSTDDLPEWAAVGSIAFDADGTTAKVKGVDGSWADGSDNTLVLLLLAIPQ